MLIKFFTSVHVNSRLVNTRISKAKLMMAPYVLRRKKLDVLGDLPVKTVHVHHCDMTPAQKELYRDVVTNARSSQSVSKNVLMDLRKVACHPFLMRRLYRDEQLPAIAKDLLKTEFYWEETLENVILDLSSYSDYQIHSLVKHNKRTAKYILGGESLLDCGKLPLLKSLLEKHHEKKERVVLFSQFKIVLDFLEEIVERIYGYKTLRMDGSTAVAERQDIMDEFHNDESVFCFLATTKASGTGVNLTCANVVILYDLDFNPHNDAQAQDRCHRVGQEKEVIVHKLVTRDTIEEQILEMGRMKLDLDHRVSGGKEISVDARGLMEKEFARNY